MSVLFENCIVRVINTNLEMALHSCIIPTTVCGVAYIGIAITSVFISRHDISNNIESHATNKQVIGWPM